MKQYLVLGVIAAAAVVGIIVAVNNQPSESPEPSPSASVSASPTASASPTPPTTKKAPAPTPTPTPTPSPSPTPTPIVYGTLGFEGSFTVDEDKSPAIITVSRTLGTDGVVSVDYEVVNGTANANDFSHTRGTLTFPAGVASRTFTVSIVNDTDVESDETLTLQLRNATGGATLGTSSAMLTIVDDDEGAY